jgi:phage FluMu protein gp41
MITEKCALLVGIEHNGKVHFDVKLRPQKVGDAIEALENDRARNNDSYLGLCVLAKQMVQLGDIPAAEITPELLMELYETDMSVINEALRRLQVRLTSFRGADKNASQADSGAA